MARINNENNNNEISKHWQWHWMSRKLTGDLSSASGSEIIWIMWNHSHQSCFQSYWKKCSSAWLYEEAAADIYSLPVSGN